MVMWTGDDDLEPCPTHSPLCGCECHSHPDDPWGERDCPHAVRDASRSGIVYCVDCGAVVYAPHQDLRPEYWPTSALSRLANDIANMEG